MSILAASLKATRRSNVRLLLLLLLYTVTYLYLHTPDIRVAAVSWNKTLRTSLTVVVYQEVVLINHF